MRDSLTAICVRIPPKTLDRLQTLRRDHNKMRALKSTHLALSPVNKSEFIRYVLAVGLNAIKP